MAVAVIRFYFRFRPEIISPFIRHRCRAFNRGMSSGYLSIFRTRYFCNSGSAASSLRTAWRFSGLRLNTSGDSQVNSRKTTEWNFCHITSSDNTNEDGVGAPVGDSRLAPGSGTAYPMEYRRPECLTPPRQESLNNGMFHPAEGNQTWCSPPFPDVVARKSRHRPLAFSSSST